MVGRRLRQYLITASLGRGGMGEVWLARDTVLERDVAIKTLPPASDADAGVRKERFFREARAASALNHPNIITIYEINADEGIDFIAMEFVEGRTLADLLEQGPVPIEQVRKIAQQIAEAVGRAHGEGIVHRDLKPRNVMVKRDGLVKVLDFGLAKFSRAGGAESAADAATQMALTRVGTTVGTLGYMSPEQAIGDPVDARSDVFSFGVMLYEMLTGRLPFGGDSMSEVLRQLHFAEPPAIETLRPEVPAALRAVVTKAIRKKPEDRFADMSEAADALSGRRPTAAATVAVAAPPPAASVAAPRSTRFTIVAVVVVVLAFVAGLVFWPSRTPSSQASATGAPIVEPAPPPAPPSVPPVVEGGTKSPGRAAARTLAPRPLAPAAPRGEPVALTHLHWGRLGDAHRAESGREADAEAAYRRAIALVDEQIAASPDDAVLHSWRALYLAKLGDRDQALAALNPVSARTDLAPDVWFRTAVVYEVAGGRERALMALARALNGGYPARAVMTEPALAALRADPRFQRLANASASKKRARQ